MLSRLLGRFRAVAQREDLQGAVLLADVLGMVAIAVAAAWGLWLAVFQLDPELVFLAVLRPRIALFLAVAAAMIGAALLWRRAIASGEVPAFSKRSLAVPAFLILLVLLIPRTAASQLGPDTKVALFERIIRQACDGDYEGALHGAKLIADSPRLDYFRSDAARFARYIEAAAMVREAADARAAEGGPRMRIDEIVAKSILFGDKGQAAVMRRFNILLSERGLDPIRLGSC